MSSVLTPDPGGTATAMRYARAGSIARQATGRSAGRPGTDPPRQLRSSKASSATRATTSALKPPTTPPVSATTSTRSWTEARTIPASKVGAFEVDDLDPLPGEAVRGPWHQRHKETAQS